MIFYHLFYSRELKKNILQLFLPSRQNFTWLYSLMQLIVSSGHLPKRLSSWPSTAAASSSPTAATPSSPRKSSQLPLLHYPAALMSLPLSSPPSPYPLLNLPAKRLSLSSSTSISPHLSSATSFHIPPPLFAVDLSCSGDNTAGKLHPRRHRHPATTYLRTSSIFKPSKHLHLWQLLRELNPLFLSNPLASLLALPHLSSHASPTATSK